MKYINNPYDKETMDHLKKIDELNDEYINYIKDEIIETKDSLLLSNKSALETLIDRTLEKDKLKELAKIAAKRRYHNIAEYQFKKLNDDTGLEYVFKEKIKDYLKNEVTLDECIDTAKEINNIQYKKDNIDPTYFFGLALLGDKGYQEIENIIEDNIKEEITRDNIKQIKTYIKLAKRTDYESKKIEEFKEIKKQYKRNYIEKIKNKVSNLLKGETKYWK